MMKYSDIYTKFLIEYDKANVTSSYPSLTVYEIGTILYKAYLALIAQKLTGNNPRRVPFEIDVKSIEDLKPLVNRIDVRENVENKYIDVPNVSAFDLSTVTDYLYYVSSVLSISKDDEKHVQNIDLVNHNQFQKMFQTDINKPWLACPKGCLEGDQLYVAVDAYNKYILGDLHLTYVRKPENFIADDNTFNKDADFVLNDAVAEELINLAVLIALENVESPRQQTKAQIRALES